MADIDLTVSVPVGAQADLEELLRLTSCDNTSVAESRALDGATVLTAVVTLTAGGLNVFRTWVRAQVERQRTYEVRLNGRAFRGYSARELQDLLVALEGAAEQGEDSE